MSRRPREVATTTLIKRYWLPVLVYLAAIFTVSAQPNLRAPISFEQSDKLYHLLEYGLLGLLLARAFSATLRQASPIAVALIATSCGIVIGTSDEYFQSYVPGRESSAFDLMADTAGVAISQVVFRVLARD
jgi:VanZ family protein